MVVLVATDVFFQCTIALKHDALGDDIVDEHTVMADQKHCAIVVLQQAFQQLLGVNVQIIGGLVQNQNIGRLGKQLGQQQAVAFAT